MSATKKERKTEKERVKVKIFTFDFCMRLAICMFVSSVERANSKEDLGTQVRISDEARYLKW